MSVRIVIDSTADVAPEIAGRFAVVPLTVTFGTEEFVDGVTISHQEFYNRLIESDVMPTTSQATPAAFDAVLSEIAAAGDTAVIITLASSPAPARVPGLPPRNTGSFMWWTAAV